MHNLGIALGSGVTSAFDTFTKGLAAYNQVQELAENAKLRDAMASAPKPGDAIPESTPDAQIAAEARARGLTFTDDQDRAARLQAINDARRAAGIQGDFTLQPQRTYTQADADNYTVRKLQEIGTPRALMLASQLRSQNLQAQAAQMELSRRGWLDNLLSARAALAGGDMAGAAQYAAKAYSFIDDGNSAVPRMDGNHAVLDIVGPNGQVARSLRFNDPRYATEVIDRMLNYATRENYEAFVQRVFLAEQNDKNRATQLQAASIGANSRLAEARMQLEANSRLAEARMQFEANSRLEAARMQLEANAPYRDAQAEYYRQQTQSLRQRNEHAASLDQSIAAFNDILRVPPHERTESQQRLAEQLAAEIVTRDPARLVTRAVRDGDGERLETVNPYAALARSGRPTLVPNRAHAIETARQVSRGDASVEEAREFWRRNFANGGEMFDSLVVPQLQRRARRGGAQAEPPAGSGSPQPQAAAGLPSRAGGAPAPRVPDLPPDVERVGEQLDAARATLVEHRRTAPGLPSRAGGAPAPRVPDLPPDVERVGEQLDAARAALVEHRRTAPGLRQRALDPAAYDAWKRREAELLRSIGELSRAYEGGLLRHDY